MDGSRRMLTAYVIATLVLLVLAYGLVIPAFNLYLDLLGMLLVLELVAVAILSLAMLADARRNDGAVQGVLGATSPWLAGALAVLIVALVLLDQPPVFNIVFAIVTTSVLWLGSGFLFSGNATVATANARSYDELRDRYEELRQDLAVLGPEDRYASDTDTATQMARAAFRQLTDLLASIAAELGTESGRPRAGGAYVGGGGYIALWNRIHRAEEAMIMLAPVPSLLADAEHDRLRLEGSHLQDANKLLALLDKATATLEKERLSADTGMRARAELRIVRGAIDQYRDDLWDRMVRAKLQLLRTMVLTGITADGGLILAVLAGIDATPVIGASAFYVVGAVVGLFARLRSESASSSVVDDYGLANARLSVTPLISGLAALFGVVLMAKVVLPTTDVIAPAMVDDTGKVVSTIGAAREPASLHDIFDLERDPGGLLLAAVFGLTPGLVLDRLRDQADRYKRDIQSSGVTQSATETTTKPAAG